MESYRILNSETKIIQVLEPKIIIVSGQDIREEDVIVDKEITLSYVQRQSDLAIIPCNEANKDYLQYLEDVQNGAEVLPFDYEAEATRQQLANEANIKNIRKQEIIIQLNELDVKAIRPLLDGETDKVEEIKAQKVALRQELQSL